MKMLHLNDYALPRTQSTSLNPCRYDHTSRNSLTLIDLTEEDNTGKASGKASAMLISSTETGQPAHWDNSGFVDETEISLELSALFMMSRESTFAYSWIPPWHQPSSEHLHGFLGSTWWNGEYQMQRLERIDAKIYCIVEDLIMPRLIDYCTNPGVGPRPPLDAAASFPRRSELPIAFQESALHY